MGYFEDGKSSRAPRLGQIRQFRKRKIYKRIPRKLIKNQDIQRINMSQSITSIFEIKTPTENPKPIFHSGIKPSHLQMLLLQSSF